MKQIILYCVLLLCTGCSILRPNKIVGTYFSHCRPYGLPELRIDFNSDGTFTHKNLFGEKFFVTWEVNKDTLILYSDKYMPQPPDSFLGIAPRYKHTELEGRDAYLIRGKKLFCVTKTGFTKDCYLFKVKKPIELP